MQDLAVVIPTRGRPENIVKVIGAWDFTNAWDHAHMVLAVDADDPKHHAYMGLFEETKHPDTDEPLFSIVTMDHWVPMVRKLNTVAANLAHSRKYFALGFAGDDHLPRTIGWAERYLTVLREMGSGMVYGDDGYQGIKLATQWAVTSDTVRALDRMVPADVEHMYCDNAVMDLFGGAGAMRYLPEVVIEHMHPIVGKAETDDQYQRVNHRDQFAKDRRAYESWRGTVLHSMQIDEIRKLRKGRPDVEAPKKARNVVGSGPRRVPARPRGGQVERSGPTSARGNRIPKRFSDVRAATPEDVMTALADFAAQVPAGQEIVELGVFRGRTALQLAWGAEQGNGNHVTGIDPWDLEGNVYDPPFTDQGGYAEARTNIENLGYAGKIELIQAFSHEVAPTWGLREKPVGLLFVDGDHTYEGARRDIVEWAPYLAPGARIAVDDYGHPDWPGVGQAVDDLVAEGFLEPIELHADRLAVTRLVTGPQGWNDPNSDPLADTVRETERMTAITSEGVSPSPYPAVAGQVADGLEVAPEKAEPAMTTHPSIDRFREVVNAGELEGITNGTPIDELNLVYLKALAKNRGIVLGVRKDKRAEILQALRDGK